MAGQLTVAGVLTGTPEGTVYIGPVTITPNALNKYAATSLEPASGSNTVAVPAWAVGCRIIPDPTNAVAFKVKTVGGDTGTNLNQTTPSGPILFDAVNMPANLYIVAASNFTTYLTVEFF